MCNITLLFAFIIDTGVDEYIYSSIGINNEGVLQTKITTMVQRGKTV
jgi:predicted Fe-Mo cluster-binding NifX family protein